MGDEMAGPHAEKKLTAVRVKALREPGKHEDGGGLRIAVDPSGAKRWVVRVSVDGSRIERGLGSFPDVSLEAARAKAGDIRRAAKDGVDLRVQDRRLALSQTTFRQMFDISFAQREKRLSNAKHLKQWPSTMNAYVFPKIGDMPVADVTTADVLDVLTPIWSERAGPATAATADRAGPHAGTAGAQPAADR